MVALRKEPIVPSWALVLLEVVFVALFVAGVMFIYWPAALLVAGAAGVVACERWAAAETERRIAARGRATPK